MTNPNAPYAAQPQQSGFQPQPQFQPQQPYAPRPVAPLRTQRGLLKYVLLGLVTFSIYDIWQMSEVGDSLNLLAFKRDGKHTMHYCLMFFLVGWVTLGIGWLVWFTAYPAASAKNRPRAVCPSRSPPRHSGCGASSARSSQWDRSSIYTSCCTR